MKEPLVTVLMPVYNAEKYVGEAIESILNQTFTDFEFLIIDDGSTDDSAEIIRSYRDTRIRFVQNEENIKLIATLNKGINLSRGKYICRADADDINNLDRIERQVEFMERNPEYAACSSSIEIFYENNNKREIIIYEKETLEIRFKKLYQNHFAHPASFIRKSIIEENNLRFDEKYLHSEDFFFFVKLSEIGEMHIINQPLVKARKHFTNVSYLNAETQNKNSINVIKYQLSKIGIDHSKIDFDLYFRFFYKSFDFTKKEIVQIEELIINIIKANNINNYIASHKLNLHFCGLWYHLCNNSTYMGLWIFKRYRNSELNSYCCNIKLFKHIYLFFKSLMRIR